MIDDDGHLPKWAKHMIVGTAVIAAAAVLTVATAGTGTALACFAAGTLKGAAIGAATGAVQGAVEGAVSNRIQSGSWKGTGEAVLNGAASGYMGGAITGFVVGGLTSNVCFVAGKGWVCAGALEIGDKVFLKNGCIEKIQSVKSKKTEDPVKTYNFEVDDFHTYFVGNIGIFVHNSCNVVDENGVKIQSNYPNDHGKPVHLHVIGEGKTTKIGEVLY